MSKRNEAAEAILEQIVEIRATDISPGTKATILLRLAEAYAWVSNPNQPHGGAAAPPSS